MNGLLRRTLERVPASAPLVRMAAEWQVRRAVHAARCEVKITRETVDVIRDAQIVRLSPKHLVFAPDVAAHFGAYWSTVTSADNSAMRDFSVPARHFIPALGIEIWQSGLMEKMDTIQDYLKHNPPTPGETVDKFTDAAVEKALVACGYRAWTELVGGFRTTFAVPEEMSP